MDQLNELDRRDAVLTKLFFPGFIADCWPQMNWIAGFRFAAERAYQDTKTGFLQDVNVMVICVTHCPSTGVSSCIFQLSRVDETDMSIWPVLPIIMLLDLQISKHYNVVITLPNKIIWSLESMSGLGKVLMV